MTTPNRVKIGDLDLVSSDPFERDIQYIYDEIFVGDTYVHPQIKLREGATIIDVGANVGLFSIWAARTHRPRTIYAYEASPTTYRCLVENVRANVDAGVTTVSCFNNAVAATAGGELVLNQPPWNSGLSTVLDGTLLPWVEELRAKGELITHRVPATALSHEMATRGIDVVDLLKIDVEGYFLPVLEGITPADMAKVRNIVLEAEYTEALGQSRDSIRQMLRDHGFEVEAHDAAQVMIYAWRP